MKTIVRLLPFLCLTSCAVPNQVKKAQPNIKNARITAYCRQESDHRKYKNKNTLGTELIKNHSIAADVSIFPFGTKIKFNNHIYEVCDIGSALVRKTNDIPTIDLYVSNKHEMRQWGTRFFDNIEIVEWGSFARSAEILKNRLQYAHCKVMFDRIQQKL